MNLPPSPFLPGSIVVTYARDSGGDEQERSVDQQLAAYADYARQHHLSLHQSFADRAQPGSSTVGRVGFDEMIACLRRARTDHVTKRARKKDARRGAAQPGQPDIAGVLLWKQNRFARDLNDAQYFKADLRRRGYTLVFLADNLPDAGDAQPLIEALIDWKAQRDLLDISTDAKRGLLALVTTKNPDGSYAGYAPGTAPRCYQRQPVKIGIKRNGAPRIVSRWVPDKKLWERGQLAWQMRAEGRSLREIHHKTRLFKTIGSYVTFYSNEIYLGHYHFSGHRLENFVPALCTPEQWETVQAIRRGNVKIHTNYNHPRRITSVYLLSGLIHCADCGALMNGGTNKGWRYYICSKKETRSRACTSARLGADKIEFTVIQHLTEHLLKPDVLREIWTVYQAQATQAAGDVETQAAGIREDLAAARQARKNLLDAIEQGGQIQSLLNRLADREREISDLQTMLRTLEQTGPALSEPGPGQLQELSERIRVELESKDPERIKPALRAFIVKVEAQKKSGKVFYTFPLSYTTMAIPGVWMVPPRGFTPYPVITVDLLWIKPRNGHR